LTKQKLSYLIELMKKFVFIVLFVFSMGLLQAEEWGAPANAVAIPVMDPVEEALLRAVILPDEVTDNKTEETKKSKEKKPDSDDIWRAELITIARDMARKNSFTVKGKSFLNDCMGILYASYHGAGKNLQLKVGQYWRAGMNGVATLYKAVQEEGHFVSWKKAKPGDIIFWDNTYDKNRNGKSDDKLTHVAIITDVNLETGVISYIHHNTYFNRIMEERMNMKRPAESKDNSILRWPSRNDPQQERYAAQLLHAIGSLPLHVENK
jgi:hypothetical protein